MNRRIELRRSDKSARKLFVVDIENAVGTGVIDEEMLRGIVLENRERKEIVITGRNPRQWMLEAADYITEMKCVRHPYTLGITAREGVEF